jgi:CheY-like chemotaxis protein
MTAENEFKKIAADLEARNSELRTTLANMREEHARDQAALRETDRRKDEFLATLAHELRNPLAPIRQAAMISQSPGATGEQKDWSHEVISRQVHHMSMLLDDLLDISRITRGTLELRKQSTSLASVIESALETARPAIDAKRHRLAIELPSEPVALEVDPLRLSQVLSNLLTNAAKYTEPEGEIRLTGAVRGGDLEIRVIDSGVGISAEVLPDIFQMFSQVKAVRDRSDGGLGIGLALSRGLVTLHGGGLEARSAGLGQGSEFTVYLPAGAQRTPQQTAAQAPLTELARQRRVLVADDNVDAGESLAMLLRLDGHEVELANNGTQAVELFEHMKPDFAILDIGMPGMNGYEVARRIRGSGNRLAILIAVTGWGQDADKARATEAGFDHHFTKPVEPAALSALIGR